MDTTLVNVIVAKEINNENIENNISYKNKNGAVVYMSKEDIEHFHSRKPITIEVNFNMDHDMPIKTFYINTYGSELLKTKDEITMTMIHYMIFRELNLKTNVHAPYFPPDEGLDFMYEMFTLDMYQGYVAGEIYRLCNNAILLGYNEREQTILNILDHALNLADLSDMEVDNKFVHKTISLKMSSGLKLTFSDVTSTLLTKDWLLTYHVMMYQLSNFDTFM